jgi:putative transposase
MLRRERKLQRLQGYDYSRDNHYFVTICTHNREHFFGEIKNGEMILNESGNIVENQWLWLQDKYDYVFLDEFVVMPNHFHGILIINSDNWKKRKERNSQACSVHEENENEAPFRT